MKARLVLSFLLVLTLIAGAAWATAQADVPTAETPEANAPAEAEIATETEAPAELPTLIPELTEANGGGCCEADCFNQLAACTAACGAGDSTCWASCRHQNRACRSFC